MQNQKMNGMEEMSLDELAVRMENIRDGELLVVKWEMQDDGKQS